MVGENLKRPYPAYSPDPSTSSRKIARYDDASTYQPSRSSNPSSRRSSFSQPAHPGHAIPRSRDGNPDLQGVPKTLENFIVAISKHTQSSQHLKNAESDYENMLPRYKDFPAFGTQKTSRLSQARKDFETTDAQITQATSSLLDALKEHFPEQSGPVSHQDCVSRSEFNQIKERLRADRADAREVERLREENHDMKKRLDKMEDLLKHKFRSFEKSENRLADLEKSSRATTKAVDSAGKEHALLQDQTTKDRLSFRTRCSALENEMDKSRSKHKDITQTTDSIQSTLDDHVLKNTLQREEQTRVLDLCRSNIEAFQQKLDVEINSRLKDTPTVSDPIPTSAIKNIESRLMAAERSVKALEQDASGENSIINEQLDELQSHMDKLQVKMDELQTNHKEGTLEKRSISEKVEDIRLSRDTLIADIARIEELNLSIKTELQTSIEQVKQGTLQGVPEDLKQHIEYINKTMETHIELLQRHEVRLNSVTTDDLYRQMESQFRQSYGVPAELRGLIQRQTKLESLTKGSHDNANNANKRIMELHTRYEAVAKELRVRE
jgi:DNA repair exonuclease SbcCD ATPase subunit